MLAWLFFFFFKQKTAYEMGIGDWSSDVCSSDLATGCVIACGGQLDGIAVVERQYGLHGALAEGALAHDQGAAMIAQRGGQHFRGAGTAAIDQNHNRCAVEYIAVGGIEAGVG